MLGMTTTLELRETVAKAIFETTTPRPGRFLPHPKRKGIQTFTEYDWTDLAGSGQEEDAYRQADAALAALGLSDLDAAVDRGARTLYAQESPTPDDGYFAERCAEVARTAIVAALTTEDTNG